MEAIPRNPKVPLPIHDIPDGGYLENDLDLDNRRIWPTNDGINVLGTPVGSPEFIESYLFGKGIKHKQLISFIQDVAATSFSRKAVAMLT